MKQQSSPEGWVLPDWEQATDVSLVASILERVDERAGGHDPDYSLGIALQVARALGRLTAAWESGFVKQIDARIEYGAYNILVCLPDLGVGSLTETISGDNLSD